MTQTQFLDDERERLQLLSTEELELLDRRGRSPESHRAWRDKLGSYAHSEDGWRAVLIASISMYAWAERESKE